MESWLIPLASAVASLIVTGGALLFRSGRNVVLMDDFKELEKQVSLDRHTARANLEQRTVIFQEKVEAVRDRFDIAMERVHSNENRLTRLEAKINGGPHQ